MVKILMLADSLIKGGRERRLIELLRFIDKTNEYKVDLVILKDLVEYDAVYQLKNTKLRVLKRKIKKDPFVFFQLWKVYNEVKPDIIHSWGSMPGIYALPILFFKKTPFINAMIANAKCDVLTKEWIRSKLVFPFSKVILANSQAGLNAFNVKNRGKVIHNGFNFDRLRGLESKERIREKYKIKSPYVVGMVAAFHPRKDFETFLSVAEELLEGRNDITFLAVGDGKLRPSYTDRYKNSPNIVFTGNIADVEQLMSIFDIGVLLSNSNNHLEGISNAILELMALNIPVIATRGGGTDEIVVHNSTGFLIDPLSKEQFKNALLLLLPDATMRKQMGKNAYQKILNDFSIEKMCTKTLDVYRNVL